ncbi:MAG TPA: response regulator transcription factor [Dermatophilaceae bacterium]|nr:response regulator transcription factor [Dermatophilaceae bacterium]
MLQSAAPLAGTTGPAASGATPIRVILVDDHDLVRQGVASLLQLDGSVRVIAQGSSVAEGMVLSRSVEADVLVVDVSLGDGTGLDLVREFRRRYPQMGIVVLTMHQDDETLLGALDAGASALVHKARQAEDVIAVVQQAAATPQQFSAVGLADAIRRRAAGPAVRLTPRESDVLNALAAGSSVAQVAKSLYMSESTVKTHIAKVYDKLGAKNRASAVMAAIRLGLIAAPQ